MIIEGIMFSIFSSMLFMFLIFLTKEANNAFLCNPNCNCRKQDSKHRLGTSQSDIEVEIPVPGSQVIKGEVKN